MTRQEFIERVTDFYDLKVFAANCNLEIEILDKADFDDRVEDDILEWLTGNWWWRDDFLDLLNECREMQGADWYVREGAFNYTEISEDFDYYKQKVLEMAEECDVFESEGSDVFELVDRDDEDEFDDESPDTPPSESKRVEFDEPAMTDSEMMRLLRDAVSGAVSAP